MKLDDKARDWSIVYKTDFSKESIANSTDWDITMNSDIPSYVGGGVVWVIEHKPTGGIFVASYYDDKEIEDTVEWFANAVERLENKRLSILRILEGSQLEKDYE